MSTNAPALPATIRTDVAEATSEEHPTSETSARKSAATNSHFRTYSLAKTPLIIAPDHPDLYAAVPDQDATLLVPITSPRVHAHLNGLIDAFSNGDPDAYLTKHEFLDHIDFFRAKANRVAKRRPVFKRTAWLPEDEAIWIDLARPDGLCIRTTASGWTIEEPLHPLFLRYPTQLPLPEPQASDDGEIAFRRILPSGISEEHTKLLLGAILGCLIPPNFAASFAFPAIVISGDAGSGKTTLAKLIKRLVDNEITTVATKPRSVDDLFVDAQSSHLLSYDNLDFIKHSLSDGLCQLLTGSAVTKRRLFTDSDRAILRAHNPVLLNGINVDMPKSDLLDRSVHVQLARITAYDPNAANRVEADLPLVMGYLCDLLVRALRNYASTQVKNAPRLSLLAKICAAAEPFGCETPYVDLLRESQKDALLASRDNDLVIGALFDLLHKETRWHGTYKQLLTTLSSTADDATTRSPEWPATPHKLARHMKEHATLLRAQGLHFENGRKTEQGRLVTVCRLTNAPSSNGEMDIPF